MIIVMYSVRDDKEEREQQEDFIGMFLPVHALGTVGMDVTHFRKSLNNKNRNVKNLCTSGLDPQ